MPDLDIVARLKLAGDTFSSEFDARMKRVEDTARSTSSRVNAALGGLGTATRALVAGVGITAITELAHRGLEYASSLNEVAQQLGVTSRDLQVYRYAGSQVGIEQDAMDRSLAKLTATLGKAALGAKAPQAAFAALGINLRDVNGHVITAGQAIPQIADALGRVGDPAQRAAVEVALFGKAGQQLDTLLAGGSAQINSLTTAAEQLGIVLSDRQIQDADKTADKLSELKMVLEARIAGVVADNANSIYNLANSVATLSGQLVDFTAKHPRGVAAALGFALGGPGGAAIAYGLSDPTAARQKKGSDAIMAASSGWLSGGLSVVGTSKQGLLDAADQSDRKTVAAIDTLWALKQRTQIKSVRDDASRKILELAKTLGIDGGTGLKSAGPSAVNADLPDFLDKVTKGHAGLTAAQKASAEAAKEMADSEKQMQDILQDLVGRYDPATAAAEKYAATIRDINDLASSGAIGVGQQVTLSLAAGNERRDAELKGLEDASRAINDKSGVTDWWAEWHRQQDAAAQEFVRSGANAGDVFGDHALASIRQVSETLESALGLRIGGSASRALSIFGGSGNSADPFQKGMEDAFQPLIGALGEVTHSITGTFGASGSFKQTLGEIVGNAALGSLGGSAFASITGGRNNQLASALGGALGGEAGKTIGKSVTAAIGGKLGDTLGGLAGPLGSVLGGVLGNVAAGLFSKPQSGGATITSATGTSATFGNNAAAISAASSSAQSVQQAVQQIAEQLGGVLGGWSPITIGTYGKDNEYRVNTYGGSTLGGSSSAIPGVDYFGSGDAGQQAAIADAIRIEVERGVITGISGASRTILAAGGDLSTAIQKALLIEQIPKDLKAMLDPVGAALDTLNAKWTKTVAALKEGNASTEQMAQAERLYQLQIDQTKASVASASQSLKDFVASMKVGADSPYSLRDQESTARGVLQPFLDQISSGASIDQTKYQAAAKSFLDVERQLYGSTQEYFDALDSVQAATNKAIAQIDNVSSISPAVADPFGSATADNTAATAQSSQASAEILSQVSETMIDVRALLSTIAANTSDDGSGDFIGSTRAYG